MRGLIDNSVNLGGAQNITGDKALKNDISSLTTPEQKKSKYFYFKDANGVLNGGIQTTIDTDLKIESVLFASSMTTGTRRDAALRCVLQESGRGYVTAPQSSETNSVVTTVSHKYTDVNNIKFGNGLIIQWGKTDTPQTVTFSTPYTETPTVLITQNANGNDQRNVMVNSITTTSFKTYRYNSEVASLEWFSIGI